MRFSQCLRAFARGLLIEVNITHIVPEHAKTGRKPQFLRCPQRGGRTLPPPALRFASGFRDASGLGPGARRPRFLWPGPRRAPGRRDFAAQSDGYPKPPAAGSGPPGAPPGPPSRALAPRPALRPRLSRITPFPEIDLRSKTGVRAQARGLPTTHLNLFLPLLLQFLVNKYLGIYSYIFPGNAFPRGLASSPRGSARPLLPGPPTLTPRGPFPGLWAALQPSGALPGPLNPLHHPWPPCQPRLAVPRTPCSGLRQAPRALPRPQLVQQIPPTNTNNAPQQYVTQAGSPPHPYVHLRLLTYFSGLRRAFYSIPFILP